MARSASVIFEGPLHDLENDVKSIRIATRSMADDEMMSAVGTARRVREGDLRDVYDLDKNAKASLYGLIFVAIAVATTAQRRALTRLG